MKRSDCSVDRSGTISSDKQRVQLGVGHGTSERRNGIGDSHNRESAAVPRQEYLAFWGEETEAFTGSLSTNTVEGELPKVRLRTPYAGIRACGSAHTTIRCTCSRTDCQK